MASPSLISYDYLEGKSSSNDIGQPTITTNATKEEKIRYHATETPETTLATFEVKGSRKCSKMSNSNHGAKESGNCEAITAYTKCENLMVLTGNRSLERAGRLEKDGNGSRSRRFGVCERDKSDRNVVKNVLKDAIKSTNISDFGF